MMSNVDRMAYRLFAVLETRVYLSGKNILLRVILHDIIYNVISEITANHLEVMFIILFGY